MSFVRYDRSVSKRKLEITGLHITAVHFSNYGILIAFFINRGICTVFTGKALLWKEVFNLNVILPGKIKLNKYTRTCNCVSITEVNQPVTLRQVSKSVCKMLFQIGCFGSLRLCV